MRQPLLAREKVGQRRFQCPQRHGLRAPESHRQSGKQRGQRGKSLRQHGKRAAAAPQHQRKQGVNRGKQQRRCRRLERRARSQHRILQLESGKGAAKEQGAVEHAHPPQAAQQRLPQLGQCGIVGRGTVIVIVL